MPADSNASMLHDHGRFAPDRVANLTFGTSFRGFDQSEVRAFLVDLAKELRAARERESTLQAKVDELEEQVQNIRRDARNEPAAPPKAVELDDHEIAARLGEETVRIVEAAREAASGIRTKAEESVAELLREARDEATKIRADADDVLRVRTEAAEVEAGKIKEAAESVRQQAVADGEAEVEKARQQGREMIAETRALRERMLHDLAQRRRLARQQLEQLRVGRERLLQAYDVVRATLDQVTNELEVAVPEAQAAAADAGARVAAEELEPTIQELEAELAHVGPLADHEAPPAAAPASAPMPKERETDSEADGSASEPAASDGDAGGDAGDEGRVGNEGADSGDANEDEGKARSGGRRARRGFTAADAAQLPKGERSPVEPSEPFEEVRVIAPGEGDGGEGNDGEGSDESANGRADGGTKSVDDLFARLRAERAETEGADDDDSDETAESTVGEVGDNDDDVAPAPDTDAATDGDTDRAGEPEGDGDGDRQDGTETTDGAAVAGDAGGEAGEAGEHDDASHDADSAVDSEADSDELVEPGDRARDELLERRNAATDAVEKVLVRRLKRVLADEQNEVLDRLRRGAVAAIGDVLPPLADHTARYANTATESLQQATASGAAFFPSGDAARATDVAVADLANELAELIVSLLRERIERAVVEVSGDADELADRVRASYRDWKTQRISETAQHYVVAAFTRGVFEAHDVGIKLDWIIDDGGTPCPDCDDNALAGAVEKGTAFPTGSLYPPAHPGCRCLIVPGQQ